MWEDPIVDAIHRARRKIALEQKYDIGVFFAELRREEAIRLGDGFEKQQDSLKLIDEEQGPEV